MIDLSEFRPTIVIDTREQTPLTFTRLPAVRGSLMTGDYSAKGSERDFCVERKSVDDLVKCCLDSGRDRFCRELHRMRGFRFRRLLIVGLEQDIVLGNYRSKIQPESVLHSLAAWECRYGVPFVFRATPESAAQQVESWASWYVREWIFTARNIHRGLTKEGSI